MADPSLGGFRTLNTGEQVTANYVWDTDTLSWIPQTANGGVVGPAGDVNVTNSSIPVTQAGTWNINTTDTHTTASAPISVRLTDGSSFYSVSSSPTLTTAAKGSTLTGNPTSENTDTNTQALHVKFVNSSMPVTGTFWQATQPVSFAGTLNTSDNHTTAAAPLAVRLTDGSSFYTVTNPLSTSAKGATGAGGPTSENTSADIQSLHTRITNSSLAVTGSFWQATQPVSLASLPTLATGTNTIGSVKLTDGTSVATVGNLTNNKALATMIVDGTGNQITSFGGGTQYSNGTTQATPVGTVAMGKNPSNVLNALSLDSSGYLNINLAAGSITGGNGAASATGSAVPSQAGYTGFNSGGTLVGVSSANPLPAYNFGTARTTNPSAVSDGAVSNVMTDKVGRLVVAQGHARELVGKQATTLTSTTSPTTVVTAGGASVFTDITSITVTNGSATATTVTLSDGTVSQVYNVPAGGGFTIPYNPPMPATTANTAWTLQCGTSVASVYCNIVYTKNI